MIASPQAHLATEERSSARQQKEGSLAINGPAKHGLRLAALGGSLHHEPHVMAFLFAVSRLPQAAGLTLYSHAPHVRAILEGHVKRLSICLGCSLSWRGLRRSYSSSHKTAVP